jgi:hypothetical protein
MKTHKVVYNTCYGGYSFSLKAAQRLLELGVEEMREQIEHQSKYKFGECCYCHLDRHDPRLAQVVEELGVEANGAHADLDIATISGNRYRITYYDGRESVQEPSDVDWVEIKDCD